MSLTIGSGRTADERGITDSVFPRIFPFNGSDGADYATGWDLCVLGGDKIPGFAEVTGNGIMLKKDPNAKAGSNGGKPVYHGLQEQEFKVKIIIWTQRHLDVLWDMRPRLIPLPGVDPKNVSIDSPWLKLIGVTSVAVIGATGLTPHSSARVAKGLEMTLTVSHWLGGSKGAGKNVTVAPKRSYRSTRRAGASSFDEVGGFSAGPTPPTNVPGACGPPNHS